MKKIGFLSLALACLLLLCSCIESPDSSAVSASADLSASAGAPSSSDASPSSSPSDGSSAQPQASDSSLPSDGAAAESEGDSKYVDGRLFVYYDSLYDIKSPQISLTEDGFGLNLNGKDWMRVQYTHKPAEGPALANNRCIFLPVYYLDENDQIMDEGVHWMYFYFYTGESGTLPPASKDHMFTSTDGVRLIVDENRWFDTQTWEWVEYGVATGANDW